MTDPAPPEDLAEAYRAAQTPASPRCPGADRLAALALQELSGDERIALADHVVSCSACSRDYRLLLDTHREASRDLAPEQTRIQASWWRLAALAAGLAALAFGLMQLRPTRPADGTDGVRSGRPTLAADVSPPSGAAVDGPLRFTWPAEEAAAEYTFTLHDSEGRPVFRSGTLREPRVEPQPAVRQSLREGHTYFWVVTVDRDGARKRLGPYWFRIAPAGTRSR